MAAGQGTTKDEARLVLVRHAFADGPGDPPLSTYGHRQAGLLAGAIRALGPFSRAVVSPARRTRETFEHLADGWDLAPTAEVLPEAGVGRGAEILTLLLERPERTLVVTHEDVIAAVTSVLCGTPAQGCARASTTELVERDDGGWSRRYRRLDEDEL